MLDQQVHSPVATAPGRQVSRGPTTGDAQVARTMHTAAVVTPEAVLLEFRAAGIASRLLAKGIDLIIQFLGVYAVLLVSIAVVAVNQTMGLIFVLVSLFLVFFAYPLTEAFWSGQTIGKKVLGIRVITTEGGPVGFRHASIRALIWVVEFLFPPGGLLALAFALLTRRSQRVGDLAAGTVVVRSSKSKMSPLFFSPARGAEHFSSTFDAGRIGPVEYALVREFLSRAHEFDSAARWHVSMELASGLERVSGRPRPSDVPPEHYLVSACFALQQRFSPAGIAPTAPPPPPTARRHFRPPSGSVPPHERPPPSWAGRPRPPVNIPPPPSQLPPPAWARRNRN